MSGDETLQFTKEIGTRTDLTEREKAQLIAAKIASSKAKSRMHYRIEGARRLTGGRSVDIELSPRLEKLASLEAEDFIRKRADDRSENEQRSVIEFVASHYAVFESEKLCCLEVERYGKMDEEVAFK